MVRLAGDFHRVAISPKNSAMFLLEHDGKTLLAGRGIPVPDGVVVATDAVSLPALPPGPWMVKAQVATGGRGKAGGVRAADAPDAVAAELARLAALELKGLAVREARIERRADFTAECYLSLALDPDARAIRVMAAAEGGVAIEENPERVQRSVAAPDATQIAACIAELASGFAAPQRAVLTHAARPLAEAFLALDAALLEINPLFVLADGGWCAGDVKLVTDDNALERNAALSALLDARAAAYPDAARKRDCGFDYVTVDPLGEIGLLTTGAGLSMMLIDEMRALGMRPCNFLDIRSGELRGDPARLIQALRWIMEGPNVRVLLMNFFAGVTDLGELARLILEALDAVPEARRLPIVARLVGNGFEKAQAVASAPGSPLTLETDLDAAVAAVRAALAEPAP